MSQQMEDNRPPSPLERLDARIKSIEDALGKGDPPSDGLNHRVKHIYQYLTHRDGGSFFEPFHHPDWNEDTEEDFSFIPNDGRRYQLVADGLIKADARKKGLLHIYCLRCHLQVESLYHYVITSTLRRNRREAERAVHFLGEGVENDKYSWIKKFNFNDLHSASDFSRKTVCFLLLYRWAPDWTHTNDTKTIWKSPPSCKPRTDLDFLQVENLSKSLWGIKEVRNATSHRSEESLEHTLRHSYRTKGMFGKDKEATLLRFDQAFALLCDDIRTYIAALS